MISDKYMIPVGRRIKTERSYLHRPVAWGRFAHEHTAEEHTTFLIGTDDGISMTVTRLAREVHTKAIERA